MEKKKLFLTSTDVQQITGLSMRTARNIMQFIRDERQLGTRQYIHIYDFCSVFNLPVNVLFDYLNTNIYHKGPIDDEALRRDYQKKSLEDGYTSYLQHKDFEICMTAKDLKKYLGSDELDDESEVA
ncbi:hypothetical protein [Winogradskyella sp. SM1960]|uniref:hypothetical protein n=1 Tax=Winogradskyella sp. SM1960 TaxID=2865955 RepID=UPI001CD1D4AD|nr:hypothetical protein [Winogradskyella sp. SM1960]